MIDEIGVTTREQGSGIHQINDAITQLDQVTQQNAALVEESSGAAESLNDQARHLVELMSAFQVEGRASSTAPRHVPLRHLWPWGINNLATRYRQCRPHRRHRSSWRTRERYRQRDTEYALRESVILFS